LLSTWKPRMRDGVREKGGTMGGHLVGLTI